MGHVMRRVTSMMSSPSFRKNRVRYFQMYILIMVVLAGIVQGYFVSVTCLLPLSILVLIWSAESRKLLLALIPFLVLLISYEMLRGYADNLGLADVHVQDLIDLETGLFGRLPTAAVQDLLLDRPYTPVVTWLARVFYVSHFVIPVVLAIILWYTRRRLYWIFMIGLMVLTYVTFLTYITYPAAPPWWAAHYGYIDEPITLNLFMQVEDMLNFSNPVAAMPSLHAAYPAYVMLVGLMIWGRKMIWFVIIPAGVWFSTVYLAHHYVIDLLVGTAYAIAVFGVVYWPLYRRYAQSQEIS